MLLIYGQQTDENVIRKLLTSVKETNIALFRVVVVVAANFWRQTSLNLDGLVVGGGA